MSKAPHCVQVLLDEIPVTTAALPGFLFVNLDTVLHEPPTGSISDEQAKREQPTNIDLARL